MTDNQIITEMKRSLRKLLLFMFIDGGCDPHTPFTMNTAAPEGTPPRRIDDGEKKIELDKTNMPRRASERP